MSPPSKVIGSSPLGHNGGELIGGGKSESRKIGSEGKRLLGRQGGAGENGNARFSKYGGDPKSVGSVERERLGMGWGEAIT